MSEIKKVSINEITPDDHNANMGSQRGKSSLDASLQRYGAGRSILLDRNNRIIAGNQTFASAGELGFEDVIVVESDGKSLVAVKRTDLDLNDKDGREMAYADNRVSQQNLSWNPEVLKEDWENPELELGAFFNEREIEFFTSTEEESLWPEEEEEEEKPKTLNDWSLKVQCESQEARDNLAETLQAEGYYIIIK